MSSIQVDKCLIFFMKKKNNIFTPSKKKKLNIVGIKLLMTHMLPKKKVKSHEKLQWLDRLSGQNHAVMVK